MRDLLADRVRQSEKELSYTFLVRFEVRNRLELMRISIGKSPRLARISARSDQPGNERCSFIRKVSISWRPFWPACLGAWWRSPCPLLETWNLSSHDATPEGGCRRCGRRVRSDDPQDFQHGFGQRRQPLGLRGHALGRDRRTQEGDYDLGAEPIDATAPAYFQYTSGSTSSPSGVVITHQNLMHHLGALHKSCGYGGGVTVTWMPHFHDYGLVQGLLQPLFSGDPCYFMSPLSFLKRPSHWLAAISKYRGTHSQAPNIAYEHCIRRVSPEERSGLNLASWQAAGNAAEPINPEVLEKFIETFAPCGFRRAASAPAYGLAEATLLVSSTRLNAGPRILELDVDAVFDGRVTPRRDRRCRPKGCQLR